MWALYGKSREVDGRVPVGRKDGLGFHFLFPLPYGMAHLHLICMFEISNDTLIRSKEPKMSLSHHLIFFYFLMIKYSCSLCFSLSSPCARSKASPDLMQSNRSEVLRKRIIECLGMLVES